jgi:hypothetical protein
VEEHAKPEEVGRARGGKVLLGWVLCAIGVVLAFIGAFFVSIAIGAVAILLGVAGYALGARNPGRITAVLGVVSIFVGLLIGQGVIPGSYDRVVDGWFREMPTERFTEE